jgi:hypothetical protein
MAITDIVTFAILAQRLHDDRFKLPRHTWRSLHCPRLPRISLRDIAHYTRDFDFAAQAAIFIMLICYIDEESADATSHFLPRDAHFSRHNHFRTARSSFSRNYAFCP